jgi:uncharacterized protein
MDPIQLITKYYPVEGLAFRILVTHSQAVSDKATQIAKRLGLPDGEIEFIRQASMLHDIGILFTATPELGCYGDLPYICHGFKGHDLLLSEGLPKHALVCERHTGTGLTLTETENFNGLLPVRPMKPVSLAEQIITYCDKFFSKDPAHTDHELPFQLVLEGIRKYGDDKATIFKEWHQQFNLETRI